jgi:hypothetical protein
MDGIQKSCTEEVTSEQALAAYVKEQRQKNLIKELGEKEKHWKQREWHMQSI